MASATKAVKATKTIKQALDHKPQHAAWFRSTQELFNQAAAFYFSVVQAHPGVLDLSSQQALTALERLTHTTARDPHPVMPLSDAIAVSLPVMFRRAAIHAALGSARSFMSHLSKWRNKNEKAEAKGKQFTRRPPVPPRSWNRSVTLYAGMYQQLTASSILLKVWTSTSWAWVKVRISGRRLPEGWGVGSPQLVHHGSPWWLHTPLEREMERPKKVETQVALIPDTRICAVDRNINEHLAVCTVQTIEGTVVATRFIGGGKQLHGFRKRQLGRIARNRRKTGIIAEREQDNTCLWAKVRALDEEATHRVSRRIVEFATAHGASVLVFEHLGHFTPKKGTYSKRGNEKHSYWLKGRIFHYARYKAWHEGIVTCRVNPRNTSRECARCQSLVARYDAGQPADGYTLGAPLVFCPQCQMHGNAVRNASLVIGKHRATHISQEKPHAPLLAEKPAKAGGVRRSQDARRRGRPSTDSVRHGTANAQGTAHEPPSGMAEEVSGIPHPLRRCNE